ncbi:MAG: ATP-binding protein [Planctomycetota bacterium]|nr:ATP-binding protein [Planctomycetota bacterium]
MRDLSLHILDLIENSIRAGASIISISVSQDPARDLMEISVEDNGRGLSVPTDVATDPFYTTKEGKRVGLGLSLLREAAERAGGKLTTGKSELGGAAVVATMRLSHLDRSPLGDLAATISSIVCTRPELDLRCRLLNGKRERVVRVSDESRRLGAGERCGLTLARIVAERIREGIAGMGFVE